MIDFRAVNDAALANARAIIPAIIPGGKFRSLEYVVRNPRRADQHPGSFTINYRTGVWKDFATGDAGGDLISLVAFVNNCSQGDAAASSQISSACRCRSRTGMQRLAIIKTVQHRIHLR